MVKKAIDPFQNESDTLQIGDLTIENRTDRVSFFGNLDITKDKKGLAAAQELKGIFELVVKRLEKVDLPDQITVQTPDNVKNPFS